MWLAAALQERNTESRFRSMVVRHSAISHIGEGFGEVGGEVVY